MALAVQLAHPLVHQGVHDGVQLRAQAGLGEDQLAQAVPVQAAVRPDHLRAEHRGDLAQPGSAGLHHLAGGLVRVHDRGPARGEPPRHLALAGTDPAGEPDPKHPNLTPIADAERAGFRVSCGNPARS